MAARHAQYTNFGVKPELFAHKSEVLARHCRDLGRDFDQIIRSANFNVVCAESEAGAREKIDWVESRMREYVPDDLTAQQAKLYKYASGTPEQVITYFKEWEALGLDYAIVYFPDPPYDLSGLELFASDVIPAMAG